MKTTIEINGYEIVIEATEESVSVSALKEGETVEEFTLETEEGDDEGQGMRSFGEEEEDDFEDAEEDLEGAEEDIEDAEEDLEDVEEEGKMESFNTFIRKRK